MKRRDFLKLAGASMVVTGYEKSFAENKSANNTVNIFAHENLVAWCIVPFDSKKRGPEERAAMLEKLGIKRLAYDWRAEHVPTFEAEIEATRKHGIEFFAFWGTHEEAFKLFEKHNLKPQIWVMIPVAPGGVTDPKEQVKFSIQRILPMVERTGKLGCPLAFYNHGGWGGEPENMIAVTKRLREEHGAPHVGICYNLHHGHGHLDRFATVLKAMKPYLFCLNLNGMTKNGDKIGKKILPLGQGDLDLQVLKIICDS
ncbi:MAG: TIM barrel protein, partial [Kiritimatiellae bacterium]|nr:TIM barrel protein [Kiritimatiellia bacterium]